MVLTLEGMTRVVMLIAALKLRSANELTPDGMFTLPWQEVFPVTTLFTIVKEPELPQRTSPLVPSYGAPKAVAGCRETNEDAAIDNTTRIRNGFFIYGYSGLFSFQTEKHPEGDDPEPVISKAHSRRI
jgi:hypothetical protein